MYTHMAFRGTFALLALLVFSGIGTAAELDPKLNPSAAPGPRGCAGRRPG